MSSPTPDVPPPPSIPSVDNKEERLWAALCHLSALAGIPIPVAGNIVGPLVVWLIKKDQFPLVDDQGKEAINFQITVLIYLLVSVLLFCVGIGIVLTVVVGIYALVMTIIATIKANQGIAYRYPLTIRLIR